MQATEISWTDFSSNPIRYRDATGRVVWACVHASDGCIHCYAETLAHRYGKGGPFTANVTAKVTPFLDEKEMRILLTSSKLTGKRVFLGDMTDVFGEWVPDEMLASLFAVLFARPDVMFQILTKRADRMRGFMTALYDQSFDAGWARTGILPNVWLGVSVEDQRRADERIPLLLETPAAVRFLSCEPLLGPLNLKDYAFRCENVVHDEPDWDGDIVEQKSALHWVIVGGESGPGARPCSLRDVRRIVRDCQQAAVPVFVKQLGARPCSPSCADPACTHPDCDPGWLKLHDPKGGNPDEWPKDLRVREYPDA